ncbi:MAG TPA: magnesium/cobalt transporter CorA [Terriglobales bacterium]|jgi:magnesium transporter|nr:magnesium/cobalt transporter CorA [Terriglobales bacterium]
MATAHQYLSSLPWYDIDDPGSPALDELAKRFGLHELQIEDCRHRPQRAKLEEHDHYIFVVLKHVCPVDELTFDDLDVFLGKDFLITVHRPNSTAPERLRQRAHEDGKERLDELFYHLVDLVVDEYLPILDTTAEAISDVEAEVLERPEPDVLAQILSLKRRLVEFRRISGAMRDLVNGLMRREKGLLGDDLDPYFRDVYDHLVRTVELVETHRDILTGSLDIYLSAVANRTNEVMKVLTIYGTVSLPLVVITGFFGMNLNIPWMHSSHGVEFAVLLMLFSSVAVLMYFKRKGWF